MSKQIEKALVGKIMHSQSVTEQCHPNMHSHKIISAFMMKGEISCSVITLRSCNLNIESTLITTVNPNTMWSHFQANISRMVGLINTGTSVLSS